MACVPSMPKQASGSLVGNGKCRAPGANGRHYDVITLSKGAETKDVYFDITDWFGKL